MKKSIFIVMFLATVVSCKNNKEEENQPPKVVNSFKVAVDLIIKQDDSLQLFYQDDKTPSYDEKRSMWLPVKGSENSQIVKFELPEDLIPTNLRIDISKNPKQEPITINNFKMDYLGKTFESKDSTMIYYFSANNHIQFDPLKHTLKPVRVKNESYDPNIYTTDLLKKQVNKLLR